MTSNANCRGMNQVFVMRDGGSDKTYLYLNDQNVFDWRKCCFCEQQSAPDSCPENYGTHPLPKFLECNPVAEPNLDTAGRRCDIPVIGDLSMQP